MPAIDWEKTFSLYEFKKEFITNIYVNISIIQ